MIKARSGRGDMQSKDVFNSERVCGKHFISGKPAPYWHKHDVDWVPTLQLAKKNYRVKLDHNAYAERAERAKKRYELAPGRLSIAQIAFIQKKREIETKRMRGLFS